MPNYLEDEDLLTCKICGKHCQHLGSHIYHAHKMTARDYKTKFGLPYKMGLISNKIKDKKSKHFQKHKDKYLANFKGEASVKNRFKKGHTNYNRISAYSKRKAIDNIMKYNNSRKWETCPVCNIKYLDLDKHLYQKHKLIRVDKL